MGLAIIGVLISLYLTYVKLTSSTIICGEFSDCSKVQNSKYSSVFGIPVASFGIIYYFAMFALIYYLEHNPKSEYLKKLHLAKDLLMLWGLVFTTYLTYLEVFVIHAICLWCVGSAVVVALIAIVNVLKWRKNDLYKL